MSVWWLNTIKRNPNRSITLSFCLHCELLCTEPVWLRSHHVCVEGHNGKELLKYLCECRSTWENICTSDQDEFCIIRIPHTVTVETNECISNSSLLHSLLFTGFWQSSRQLYMIRSQRWKKGQMASFCCLCGFCWHCVMCGYGKAASSDVSAVCRGLLSIFCTGDYFFGMFVFYPCFAFLWQVFQTLLCFSSIWFILISIE